MAKRRTSSVPATRLETESIRRSAGSSWAAPKRSSAQAWAAKPLDRAARARATSTGRRNPQAAAPRAAAGHTGTGTAAQAAPTPELSLRGKDLALADDAAEDAPDLGVQRAVSFRADLSPWTGAVPRSIYFLTASSAVLFSTHDVEFTAIAAHRVLVLAAGDVVADGPTADVVTSSPAFAPQIAKVLGGGLLSMADVKRTFGDTR